MDQFIKLLTIALWAIIVMITGCSGIEPYDPPEYREKPPVQGLLTGEEGVFVIYQKVDGPDTGREPANTGKQEQYKEIQLYKQ